jgi:23S rRNA (adenine2503-C2)-methyltransferase
MIDILNLTRDELKEQLTKLGMAGFVSNQVYDWIHLKNVEDFDKMSNISITNKIVLKDNFHIVKMELVNKVESLDATQKYLMKLEDGEFIELVLLKYKYGYTLCMSSQIGCGMNCSFCASTIGGLKRNLTISELLEQVYSTTRIIGTKLSNIVIMGSGEPLQNYDNVVGFLKRINDENGYNLSLRNITLSTCGLVNEIDRLSEEDLPITLAISLHGSNDTVRSGLMPINKKYPVDAVINASKRYFDKTKRRVTFEYALIKDVNDSDENAKELGKRLQSIPCHVNLIPVNEVVENNFFPSKNERILRFRDILKKMGINVTIRRELGSDINAACGQLRNTQIQIIKKND